MFVKLRLAKIISFFGILLFLFGCNAVKRVPENEYLLTKVTVYENNTVTNDTKVTNFIQQKPNGKLLGIPLGLYIYNVARENPEKDFQRWMDEHPNWNNTLTKILSKKQMVRLRESFFVSGMHNQLKKNGEAPVILDSAKTKKTDAYFDAYFKSIGYFNVSVSDSVHINSERNQRAEVDYFITTGPRYFLDSIGNKIASAQIDSVYQLNLGKTLIKKGEPYHLEKLTEERSRLNQLFRNAGFYTFQQSSIQFDIERDTVLSNEDHKLNVSTVINNLVERDGDMITEKPYKVHRLGKINIYANYDFTTDASALDTLQYKDVTIHYKEKLKYRPKMLQTASALKSGAVYTDEDRSLTYKQINNLRVFKYPNIEYKYAKNDTLQQTLDANIYLVPLDKFSFKINTDITHSEIQDIGITFGTSFISRNVFRGGEILELNLQGTFGSQQSAADNYKFFNISEVGGDIRLVFPRILFFTNTDKIIPYSMTPQTIIQFGTNYQNNIGLDRRNLSGIFRYTWNPGKNRSILEVLNGQYVNNTNPENFFNVYQSTYKTLNEIAQGYTVNSSYLDSKGNLTTTEGGAVNFISDVLSGDIVLNQSDFGSVMSIEERRLRLIQNNFVLSSSFTYVFNRNSQFFQPDFSQFRVKLESAGNLPSAISKISNIVKNENGRKEFMGVEFSQFIRTELDYIKHWPIGKNSVLAFRSFFGIAIPYGNSGYVPFTQSYFAGGSNDNRGWKAYSLGPGSSGSYLDYNEANMKITLNLEYRFPIAGAVKGALFTDAGNIWNALDDYPFEDGKFIGFSSLKDVGVSTGFGLRYDFGFFVFRLDAGNKTYNPALEGNRWFKSMNLRDMVFNIGINYPF